MTIKTINIDDIDATGRLRKLRPDWVDAFAEQIEATEKLPPIEVAVKLDGKFKLIVGAHRLAAHAKAGRTVIEAYVMDISAADQAACQLREIKENFYRVGLTELDRCVAIAAWKEVYEASNPLPKRGRKSVGEIGEETSRIFVESFSAAAARVLGITERSVQIAVAIANAIDDGVRSDVALHAVADHQGQLIALAREPVWKQQEIAKLLLTKDSGIDSVADAIAAIDKTPAPARAQAWEKLSNGFSRLKEAEQHAFFSVHREAIIAWVRAERMTYP